METAAPFADDHDARVAQAVEALVFASNVPLRDEDIARAYGDVTGTELPPEAVGEAVARLNASYRETHRALRIEAWGGGYRMATVQELAPYLRALFEREEERRMSRSLLETLAVIAYKQPATKPEVEHVRGVKSDYALRQLLERGFVDVVGRSESVGRPLLYGTTDRFLDQFGLASLDSLPSPREVEDILADPRFSKERAQLLAGWAAAASGDESAASGEPASEAQASGAAASPEADSSEPVGDRMRIVVSSRDTPPVSDG